MEDSYYLLRFKKPCHAVADDGSETRYYHHGTILLRVSSKETVDNYFKEGKVSVRIRPNKSIFTFATNLFYVERVDVFPYGVHTIIRY